MKAVCMIQIAYCTCTIFSQLKNQIKIAEKLNHFNDKNPKLALGFNQNIVNYPEILWKMLSAEQFPKIYKVLRIRKK